MQEELIESIKEIQTRHEEIDNLEEANAEQTKDVWEDLLCEFEKAYDAERPETPAYKKVTAVFALNSEDSNTEAIRSYQKMLSMFSNAVNTLKYYRENREIYLRDEEITVSGEWTTYGETDHQYASFPLAWASMTAGELVEMLLAAAAKAEDESIRYLDAYEKSRENRERALYETLRAKYENEDSVA